MKLLHNVDLFQKFISHSFCIAFEHHLLHNLYHAIHEKGELKTFDLQSAFLHSAQQTIPKFPNCLLLVMVNGMYLFHAFSSIAIHCNQSQRGQLPQVHLIWCSLFQQVGSTPIPGGVDFFASLRMIEAHHASSSSSTVGQLQWILQ